MFRNPIVPIQLATVILMLHSSDPATIEASIHDAHQDWCQRSKALLEPMQQNDKETILDLVKQQLTLMVNNMPSPTSETHVTEFTANLKTPIADIRFVVQKYVPDSVQKTV